MKITRIENQKKRPGRKSIFVDGEFLVGVASDTLLRFGLRTGDEIDQRMLKNIARAEELLAARNASLRYLAVRPRTEREIRDQLRAKEFSDQVAAETIASLKESRLLDDAAFARSYIRNALALKPSGKILLKRKLLLLGIDKSLAEEALGEILQGVSQEDEARIAAQAFVARKTSRGKPGPSLRRQVTAYLLRRGYAWDVVTRAVRDVLKEVSGGTGEGEF